ncbi:hypothetical protein J7399_10580 [Shimia sp. R9_1]|uniref:hypothetical protein n=1 Tax=unclassified Shimia TaxID=2630038 RepID=UPI001ADC4D0E|nr:hypothetical protein [Shimia sp. R9_1]MBO9407876.1 hypothetical protein [Shimia sp. R9_1]
MRSLIAIQEGQISLEQIKALEEVLRKLYAEHICDDKLTIIWNIAAKQHTITDRKWSRSSTVTMEVPDGLETQKREAFMLEVEKSWRAVTGQHPDQVAVGAFDQSRYTDILKGNLTRFSTWGRISYLAKLFTRIFISKARYGVLITRFNQ